jgi:hypothetical protein
MPIQWNKKTGCTNPAKHEPHEWDWRLRKFKCNGAGKEQR